MVWNTSSPDRETTSFSLPVLFLLAGLVVPTMACGDRTGEVEANASLTGAELEELKREYPVLREEPAPAPKPDADAPVNIPAQVRKALSEGVLESISGEATFYADKFEGRRTASGIPFRQNQMVAAHPSYPFGTILRVTNERNGESVTVRVVDRGPFGAAAEKRGTVIDLSRRAAEQLDFIRAGRARVRVEVLEWGEGLPS